MHYLNFYQPPILDPDREALSNRAIDMSLVPDKYVTELQSMSSVSASGVSWRQDMEYLVTIPVRGKKTGPKQLHPIHSSWVTGLVKSEKAYESARDFYYTLMFHSFSPIISDYGNFVFAYGTSIIRGPIRVLADFSDMMDTKTQWGQKDGLLRGISL